MSTETPLPANSRSGILTNLSAALKIIRALGPAGKEILDCVPLPDWRDRDAVQRWAIQVIEVAQALAKLTPTTIDDAAALAVRRVLEDSTIWDAVYREAIGDEAMESAAAAVPVGWRDRVATCYGDDAADDAKIDPLTIIAIVEAVIALINWWRNR